MIDPRRKAPARPIPAEVAEVIRHWRLDRDDRDGDGPTGLAPPDDAAASIPHAGDDPPASLGHDDDAARR